jgi:hypothetical protein
MGILLLTNANFCDKIAKLFSQHLIPGLRGRLQWMIPGKNTALEKTITMSCSKMSAPGWGN